MNKQEISKKFKNLIKIASVTSLFVLTYCTNTQAAVLGDINKDGIINASDANILKSKLVQSQELTSEQKQLADLNGDGTINALAFFI